MSDFESIFQHPFFPCRSNMLLIIFVYPSIFTSSWRTIQQLISKHQTIDLNPGFILDVYKRQVVQNTPCNDVIGFGHDKSSPYKRIKKCGDTKHCAHSLINVAIYHGMLNLCLLYTSIEKKLFTNHELNMILDPLKLTRPGIPGHFIVKEENG